jgi:hypothetical protein
MKLLIFSPDLKSDDALAAVLVTRIVTSAEEPMQRTNNGAFYASIHSDLDAALALFNGLLHHRMLGLLQTICKQ